jgi:hypothetical protein
MKKTLLCLPAFFLLVSSLAAQPSEPVKVKVGDPIVSGASFKPYQNVWQMSVITPAGKEIPDAGTWSDDLSFVTIDGRQYLERTQVAIFKRNGEVVAKTKTINVFDPATLAPVSRTFTRQLTNEPVEIVHLEFRDGVIHSQKIVAGKIVANDVVRPGTPVFDFSGGMYGLLLAGFPLKENFSATLPTVDEDQLTTNWITFRVTGRETADAGPKGKVDTWIVESDTGQGPMKFWLSKEPPYIIRLEFKASNNGLRWIYRMV